MSEQDIKPEGNEPSPVKEKAQPPETKLQAKPAKDSQPKAKQPAEIERPKSSSSNRGQLFIGLVTGLLCVLIIGAGLAAYFWLLPNYQQQQVNHQQKLNQLSTQLNQKLAESQAQNQTLQQQSQSQQQALSLFRAQLKELELAQRQLRQLNQSPPEHWVLAEADYLVRLAGQRLWVETDVKTSIALLTSADERIASLHDARLVPLRRALNQDIQTLKALPLLDIEGITLILDGLIQQIDQLPIKTLEIPEAIGSNKPAEISEDPADWQQNLLLAWDSFIDGFIKVEHRVSDVAPLLSPEQSWFLVHNTKLMLQQAQLAALRAQPEHFRNSLQLADLWLKDYFEAESRAVTQARQTLAELGIKQILLNLPDELSSPQLLAEILSQPRARTPMSSPAPDSVPESEPEASEEPAL